MTEITAERARELFAYDPQTGALEWRVASRGVLKRPRRAGSPNKMGYIVTQVLGRTYLNHRLAWLIAYGEWPENQIDHINGDPADNRLCNLRDVTNTANQENQRHARRDNKLGLLGVCWCAYHSKFKASIRVRGKKINIGYYRSPAAAHEAYLTAKRQLHAGCTI